MQKRKNIFSAVFFNAVTLTLLATLQSKAQLPESYWQPAWWSERNVVTTHTNLYINDHAPANQGQVKWFALQAYLEFQDKLPGVGNSNIQQRVDGFTEENNYLPLNLGQLKHVVANLRNDIVTTHNGLLVVTWLLRRIVRGAHAAVPGPDAPRELPVQPWRACACRGSEDEPVVLLDRSGDPRL